MKIPKEIIEKAIEGGYEGLTSHDIETDNYTEEGSNAVVLDPLFWRALGKALEWPEVTPGNSIMSQFIPQTWRYNANRLLDLILTNGDTDAFWADLLKN